MILRISLFNFTLIFSTLTNLPNNMRKSAYTSPLAEVSILKSETVICASNGGSTEDFGNGTGFSFDLFEGVKPF